jgi:exportin-5
LLYQIAVLTCLLCPRGAPPFLAALCLQGELGYEGQHDEFGQTLCETLATLGASHLAAISSAASRLAFLQHMLAFAQHPYLLLADKALPMWVKLLQDAAASVTNAAAAAASGGAAAAGSGGEPAGGAGASSGAGSPRLATVALPPECIAALMDMAAEQLQKRGAHVPTEDDEVPPYFDTFVVSGTLAAVPWLQ